MRGRVKDTWWGKKAHGHMVHGINTKSVEIWNVGSFVIFSMVQWNVLFHLWMQAWFIKPC